MIRRQSLKIALVCLCILALAAGCAVSKQKKEPKITWQPNKVAVVPFTVVGGQGQDPASLRSPLTGSTFIGSREPTPPQAASYLSSLLMNNLSGRGFKLVPPVIAGPLYNRLSNAQMGAPLAKVLAETGRKLGVQAVAVGYLYRWRDRVGGNLTAQRPASVAFDVALLRVSDGVVIWKNSFDQTQKPLTENILNADLYAQEGIRWLTAQDFARYGMGVLLRDFPWDAQSKTE